MPVQLLPDGNYGWVDDQADPFAGWSKGGDFSSGTNQVTLPDGRRAVYLNDTVFMDDGGPVPAEVLAQVRGVVPTVRQATERERQMAIDPALNRAGSGGMGEGILSALKFAAMAYGAGNLLGGLGSGAGGLASASPSSVVGASPWAAPAASPSLVSSMTGSVLDSVAPAVASGWGSGIGAGTAAAGAAAGGGMSGVFDLVGQAAGGGGVDMTGFMGNAPSFTDVGPAPWWETMQTPSLGSGVDPYGLGWSSPAATGSAGWDAVLSGGANLPAGGPWNDFALNPYGSGVQSLGTLQRLAQVARQLAGGASGAKSAAGGIFSPDGSLNWGGIGSTAAGLAPGMAALSYANSQPGIDTGPLQGIIDQFGGMNTNAQESVLQRLAASDPTADLRGVLADARLNAPGYMQAVTDPVQRNIASGYGDLVRSQGLRGLGGSSFGDTSLANYMDQGNRTLANAGATAAQSALGTQAQIAGQIGSLQNANLGLQGTVASGIHNSQLAGLLGKGGLEQARVGLQNTAQKNKNDLFGRAFSAFGRGMGGGGGLGLGGLDLSALGF